MSADDHATPEFVATRHAVRKSGARFELLELLTPRRRKPATSACTDDGGVATSSYDVHQLKNTTGTDQELDFIATWTGGDGFLVVYFGTFDPLAGASDQCIAGDDDFNGMTSSKVAGVLVFPNEVLTVVASTFAASAAISSYALDVRTVP